VIENTRKGSLRIASRGVVLALLAGASLAIYAQVRAFGFVFDDEEVVLGLARAHPRLSPGAVRWALGSFHAGNWIPLTLISHLADISLFGLHPAGHHLENVMWHILCAAAAFLVLHRATASLWPSAFVAAVFAVHPLNVESVAWVAERKNLLSTLLFWLTLAAYLAYVRRPGAGRYLMVTACYFLGLMAKPMIVTVPFLLLLLDFWPLGRLQPVSSPPRDRLRDRTGRLLLEKIPWFLMAALVSMVTVRAQASYQAVVALEAIPLDARVANALASWLAYLSKAFWPVGLAGYYPLAEQGQARGEALLASLALAALTFLALRRLRTGPYLAVGWFWYLGTLVPVIGLVQVGNQAMADRYAYLPLSGVLIAVVWSCAAVAGRRRGGAIAAGAAAVAIVAGLGIAAHAQAAFWRDDRRLFERALAVTGERNPLVHHWLGQALEREGDSTGAEEHYRVALRQQPHHVAAHNSLGVLLARQGRTEEAVVELRQALRVDPRHAGAHYNLGRVLEARGWHEEAIAEYRAAIGLDPGFAEAHNQLGIALAVGGDLQGAATEFQEALRADPGLESARTNLDRALAELRLSSRSGSESR
jgi:protein O-mannosyl-transferase